MLPFLLVLILVLVVAVAVVVVVDVVVVVVVVVVAFVQTAGQQASNSERIVVPSNAEPQIFQVVHGKIPPAMKRALSLIGDFNKGYARGYC